MIPINQLIVIHLAKNCYTDNYMHKVCGSLIIQIQFIVYKSVVFGKAWGKLIDSCVVAH